MIGRKAGREAPLARAQSKRHTPWPVPVPGPVLEQNPSEKQWVGTRGQAGLSQVSGSPHPDPAQTSWPFSRPGFLETNPLSPQPPQQTHYGPDRGSGREGGPGARFWLRPREK